MTTLTYSSKTSESPSSQRRATPRARRMSGHESVTARETPAMVASHCATTPSTEAPVYCDQKIEAVQSSRKAASGFEYLVHATGSTRILRASSTPHAAASPTTSTMNAGQPNRLCQASPPSAVKSTNPANRVLPTVLGSGLGRVIRPLRYPRPRCANPRKRGPGYESLCEGKEIEGQNYTNAANPVMLRPTISVFISRVP